MPLHDSRHHNFELKVHCEGRQTRTYYFHADGPNAAKERARLEYLKDEKIDAMQYMMTGKPAVKVTIVSGPDYTETDRN